MKRVRLKLEVIGEADIVINEVLPIHTQIDLDTVKGMLCELSDRFKGMLLVKNRDIFGVGPNDPCLVLYSISNNKRNFFTKKEIEKYTIEWVEKNVGSWQKTEKEELKMDYNHLSTGKLYSVNFDLKTPDEMKVSIQANEEWFHRHRGLKW